MTLLAAVLTVIGIANGIGVGQGRYVTVHDNGVLVASGYTDEFSSATFAVEEGTVDVQIHLPGTWFYRWLCRDQFVPIDEEREFITVRCVRKWQLALPALWEG